MYRFNWREIYRLTYKKSRGGGGGRFAKSQTATRRRRKVHSPGPAAEMSPVSFRDAAVAFPRPRPDTPVLTSPRCDLELDHESQAGFAEGAGAQRWQLWAAAAASRARPSGHGAGKAGTCLYKGEEPAGGARGAEPRRSAPRRPSPGKAQPYSGACARGRRSAGPRMRDSPRSPAALLGESSALPAQRPPAPPRPSPWRRGSRRRLPAPAALPAAPAAARPRRPAWLGSAPPPALGQREEPRPGEPEEPSAAAAGAAVKPRQERFGLGAEEAPVLASLFL